MAHKNEPEHSHHHRDENLSCFRRYVQILPWLEVTVIWQGSVNLGLLYYGWTKFSYSGFCSQSMTNLPHHTSTYSKNTEKRWDQSTYAFFNLLGFFIIIIMVKDLIHLTIYKHDVLSYLIVLETETHSKSENLIVNKESSWYDNILFWYLK